MRRQRVQADPPVYQWVRRISGAQAENWVARVALAAGVAPVVTEKPGSSRLTLSLTAPRRGEVLPLMRLFGGTIQTLYASDWMGGQDRDFVLRIGGRNSLVVASEEARVDFSGPVLRIPAGMAFGTGEHTTTALCLRQIAAFSVRRSPHPQHLPWRMIDAGTGSGILALAASMWGAKVEAFDDDPVCLRECRANAARNPHVPPVRWLRGDVLKFQPRAKADVVAANLFAGLLVSALPRMHTWLVPGGHFVLSGILRNQEGMVVEQIRRLDLVVTRVLRKGKWVCVVARS